PAVPGIAPGVLLSPLIAQSFPPANKAGLADAAEQGAVNDCAEKNGGLNPMLGLEYGRSPARRRKFRTQCAARFLASVGKPGQLAVRNCLCPGGSTRGSRWQRSAPAMQSVASVASSGRGVRSTYPSQNRTSLAGCYAP